MKITQSIRNHFIHFIPLYPKLWCQTAQLRGINAQINILAQILPSRVRAEVFRILFSTNTPELHHREIVRRSGLSESAIRHDVHQVLFHPGLDVQAYVHRQL